MVKFVIPGMPPSSNNAWFNLPKGGRTLKPAGKKYKNEIQTLIGQKYSKELMTFKKHEPYLVFFRVHVEALENATWGAAKNGAENRYKKNDATNRIKILEDIIAEVTGVDDASTMTFLIQKVQAVPATNEQIEVFIWNTYREESPFDEPLSRL
jgi:hypothetical protein